MLIPLAGTLIGGLGGSVIADKGQSAAVKAVAPEFSKRMEEQAAIDEQQHPLAATLGGVASGLPFFEASPLSTIRGLSKLPALMRGGASAAEAQLAKAAALNLGMGAGQGLVSPLLSGQTPTLGDVGTGIGQALLFGKTRDWIHSIPGMPPLPGRMEPSLTPPQPRPPLLLPERASQTYEMPAPSGPPTSLSGIEEMLRNQRIRDYQTVPEPVKRPSGEAPPTPMLVNAPEVALIPSEQVRRERVVAAGTELDGLQRQLVTLPDGPDKIAALKRANDLVVELQAARDASARTKEAQGVGAEGTYPPNAEQLGTFQSRAAVPERSDVTKVPAPEKLPAANQPQYTPTPEKIGVIPPESLQAEAPKGKAMFKGNAEAAAKATGWSFKPNGAVDTAGLPPELAAKMPKPAWEFTDRRKGSATEGFTIYAPEGANKKTILDTIRAKEKEVHAANPVPEPKGNVSEHLGVLEGKNLPKNGPQVRAETRSQAGSGRELLSGTQEPLSDVQALAGGKMAPEKEAELNAWLDSILKRHGTGDIHFQLESQMASQPLDALLAHPQNQAVFDLLDKLMAKHRIERQMNPKPGGREAHGAALIADRIIHLNPDNIAPDTFAHEISEITFQDLLHSPNQSDRDLASRGLAIFNGDTERLAQALGRRVNELAQLKVEGLTLKRFKEWFRDFVSRIKEVWGKATPEDFQRMLARRIMYGDYVVRSGPADAKTIHYQGVEQRMNEETEAGARARNTVTYGTDPSIPKVRSLLDQIARTTKPELGKAFDETLRLDREYWGVTNRVLAGVDALDGAHSLTRKEMEAAGAYLFNKLDTRGQPTETPSDKTLAFEQNVWRPALAQIVAETRKYNLLLQDRNGYRFIHETPYYMPEMFRGDVIDVMKRTPNSAEAQRYETIIAEHIAEKKNISVDAARKEWQENYRDQVVGGQTGQGQTGYGPLELPHGIGVPPELREQNLFRVGERYFNRAGKALAFHRAFSLDPVAGYLAGISDQFGNRFQQPQDRPDLPRSYGDIPDVQIAMKIIKGDYDSIDRTVNAIGRVAKGLMMQTLTGTVDLATYHAQIAPWVHPAQLDVFAKGIVNIKDGIKHAFDWGVIRKRSLAEAQLATGTGYQGASAWVDRWNKLGDLINLVSGRDALERWTRGVTQSTMEALTYSNLGWLSNPAITGSRKGSAIRYMNQFAERGWERQLEQFRASPEGVPDSWVQQIAANATEHVQGTYDPRDQPKYSLQGAGAPFLSLAKWNIGALNRFTKNTLGPLKQGNPTPLLMSMGLGYLGGQAVSYVRQWLTGRKPQEATWDEVLQAGGAGLPYKLLAIASYSGFAGIAAEFAKQGMDLKQGNSVQALRWPALGFVENIGKRIGQASAAIDAGENSIDVLGDFALQISKDNIQLARIIAAHTPQGQETLQRGNLARDVRTFRLLHNYPVSPMGGNMDANPFVNPLSKTYERTEDVGEIASTAPRLVQQAIERGGGDPEKIASLMRSYRSMGSDLIPSLRSNPQQFARFLDFVGRTQGNEAAQNVVQQYFRKNAFDELKAGLIPSLR